MNANQFYGSVKPISAQGKQALANLKRAARKYKGRRPRVYATTLSLSRINSHVVDAVLAQQLIIGINGLGYYQGSTSDNSLQMSFGLSSLNAFLGSTGISTTGRYFRETNVLFEPTHYPDFSELRYGFGCCPIRY